LDLREGGRKLSGMRWEYDSPITPIATAKSDMWPIQVQNGRDASDHSQAIVLIYEGKYLADVAGLIIFMLLIAIVGVVALVGVLRRDRWK
jgi:hypothetical protein